MNRTFKFSLAAALSLLAAASCNKVDEIAEAPVIEHSFTIDAQLPGIEQEADSKGYLGSYISASWTEGDKASVVNLTSGKVLGGDLVADKTGIRATFSGTVTGTISKGDVLAIFYPSLGVGEECAFDSRKMSLSSQSKAGNVPLVTYATFTAQNAGGSFSDLDLSFFYVLSYIKMNLANLPESSTVSKVAIRNIPSEFSISINEAGTGFDLATAQEKAAQSQIVVSGPFTTSATGTMTVALGVMPSDESSERNVLVTVDSDGDYMASFASASLESHKYYNTIASCFEKVGLPGHSDYGVYNILYGYVIDEYDEFASTLVSGAENGEYDFSLLNTGDGKYWTIKGLPQDVSEGATFTARLYRYGVRMLPEGNIENATVKLIEKDGDYSKIRILAGNYLFIVRK